MNRMRAVDRKPEAAFAACGWALAVVLLFGGGAATIAQGADSQGIDWSGVPGKEIVLFYPGQSSWEWNLTESDHSGGPKLRKGKACYACHEGEEAKIGELVVSGKKIEPEPLAGRRATIPVQVQAAHDGERLYFRLEWPVIAAATGSKAAPDHESLVTILFDDGHVKTAGIGGCWATCHEDLQGMPAATTGTELSKYLTTSRTKIRRSGGGENYKSPSELDQQLADGKFMEFWQVALNSGKPPVAADGYVLERRHKNESTAIRATASKTAGKWVVVVSRALASSSASRKALVAGKTYIFGLAIHDDFSDHRFHQVSFERTLALDSDDADVNAIKQ